MNTHIIKKHTLSLKKNNLARILALVAALMCSVAYGLYIVAVLQLQFLLGSGDINAYVNYFEDTERLFTEVSVGSDYAFRIVVLTLTDVYDLTTVTLLSYMAFIISTVIFFICSGNVRSLKHFLYLVPLFLMVFFTPNVQFLFSSGIRSGIAFMFLMLAIVYFKGFIRYLLFGLSIVVHMSMLPVLSLYFGFYILNNKRIKTPFIPSLFLLVFGSFLVAVVGSQVHVETAVTSSIFYSSIIFYVGLLIIFINKTAVKNIYGFMSVGLILIYLSGIIIDASYWRYVGNAIILYLFFLINKGEAASIQIFTIGYTPFFILTLFYAISNLGG